MGFNLEYLEQLPHDILYDDEKGYAANEETTISRISKFMVLEALNLPFTPEALIKIARNEVDGAKDFEGAIREIWVRKYKSEDGLSLADIETEAEFFGVFEDIWPPDAIAA